MATPGKRAFWMHQAAEYLISAAFVTSGLQSPQPVVPTLVGGTIMLNTACSKGPLSAFRVFGRKVHRLLDVVLVLGTLVVAVLPFLPIDRGTRLIMLLLGGCMAVIGWQSDYREAPPRARRAPRGPRATAPAPGDTTGRPVVASRPGATPDGTTADTIGRSAGRLAGKGVKVYRARKAARAQPPATGSTGSTRR